MTNGGGKWVGSENSRDDGNVGHVEGSASGDEEGDEENETATEAPRVTNANRECDRCDRMGG